MSVLTDIEIYTTILLEHGFLVCRLGVNRPIILILVVKLRSTDIQNINSDKPNILNRIWCSKVSEKTEIHNDISKNLLTTAFQTYSVALGKITISAMLNQIL